MQKIHWGRYTLTDWYGDSKVLLPGALASLSSHPTLSFLTLGRRHSKKLSTNDERGSTIARNSVFDCHLSPMWRQMAIKNTVSIDC